MVRAVSPGRVYLGKITLEYANQLIRERLAVRIGQVNRSKTLDCIEILYARVDATPATVNPWTYRDPIGDHRKILKRYIPSSGTFVRWHEDLTFEDVRRGRRMPESFYRQPRNSGVAIKP